MKKKDIKYRQGRSKDHQARNEETAFLAYGFMLITFTAVMFGLLVDKLIG